MTGEAVTPKRPRPSGSGTRQRSGLINFRVSDEERTQLELAADRAGYSIGSYVRSRCLVAPTTRAVRRPTVERAALTQLYGLLGKAGSNVNQIARVLNSGGEPDADIAATLEELRAAGAAIRAALGLRGWTQDE